MKPFKAILLITFSCYYISNIALTAERWQESTFPPPGGAGRLAFAIMDNGNPGCASYDGRNCLWGLSMREIDFSRVKPLICGAQHRNVHGVTGFEDPKHWCNIALRGHQAQTAPATGAPPAGGNRMTDWSGWARAEGVEYRYRVRWDPSKSGQMVDVIYEIRNSGSRRWYGSARSLDCARDRDASATGPLTVDPGQTKRVRLEALNCGTATNPIIHPKLRASDTL